MSICTESSQTLRNMLYLSATEAQWGGGLPVGTGANLGQRGVACDSELSSRAAPLLTAANPGDN